MNRLVLIGNGFDLAHELPTSYRDFFNWYWGYRISDIYNENTNTSTDNLCSLTTRRFKSWRELMFNNHVEMTSMNGEQLLPWLCDFRYFEMKCSPFFDRIRNSVETKGWVDIENEYYELLKKYVLDGSSPDQIDSLNTELNTLQKLLVIYLKSIEITDRIINTWLSQKIYSVFKTSDISLDGQKALKEHIEAGFERGETEWQWLSQKYGISVYSKYRVDEYRKKYKENPNILEEERPPMELMLPNHIMLLNFNYTHTADLYCKKGDIFTVNQIHGDLKKPKSVIFGYGDELDYDYKAIVNKNENKFLGHIKSIKYMESDNYRKLLSFIESEPYQVLIMGHSCGNSDRTLLNTLFEHKNCVSIKPYFYKKSKEEDNYIELVQNISRNFTDMKLMRDRVVNKMYCEPLTW